MSLRSLNFHQTSWQLADLNAARSPLAWDEDAAEHLGKPCAFYKVVKIVDRLAAGKSR